MGKIIILEGPDGGGKTTLAKELMRHGWTLRHEGPPPKGVDVLEHYKGILWNSMLSSSNVVHDRLWLGERIYGPIARGVDGLGAEGEKLITRLHMAQDILMYVLIPQEKILQRNYERKYAEQDDFLKSFVKHRKVVVAYENWLAGGQQIATRYDYKDNTLADIFSVLSAKLPTLPIGMTGSYLAEHLFIGDSPNHSYIDIPFFSTKGSSGYINKALELSGLKETEIALANAFGPRHVTMRNPNHMTNLFPRLRHVFILGEQTKEWYRKNGSPYFVSLQPEGVKVHFLPHPSYMKRFMGNNPELLAKMIKG